MNSSATQSPFGRAWSKFKRNPLAMAGLIFIALVSLISLLGPFIRPDNSPNANDQNLLISRQFPGFECEILKLKLNQEDEDISFIEAWIQGGYSPSHKEIAIDSWKWDGEEIVITPFGTTDEERYSAADVVYALKEDAKIQAEQYDLNTYDGQFRVPIVQVRKEVEAQHIYQKRFLLGTDKYGRDLLSRLMAGARISLLVGFIAVLISLLIGMTLGAVAGYYGGKVDKAVMWLINVIWSVPTLLLVIAITFAFGKGFWKVFLAVGLTMWVEVARVVRGQFMSLREKEFVEAGKVLGYSGGRIIFRHILPNALGPVIVISAANFASAILIEAGLSFLGIGAQIPIPSWGNIIKEHYNLITTDLAYLAFIPGICIMLLVLAFMLVGNGIRDGIDVKGS